MAASTPRRRAALLVEDFRVQALRLRQPRLRDVPFALTEEQGEGTRIDSPSPEARNLGVRSGQTLAQALACCPDLRTRARNPALDEEDERRLVEAARRVSPRIEPGGEGVLFADAAGLDLVHGDETAVARRLVEAVEALGFERVRAAVAGTRFAAYAVAATARKKVSVVPPGRERRRLAPLPIELLPLDAATLDRLRALGLATLGSFASLPPASVALRYGREGALAHRLARGLDEEDPLEAHAEARLLVERSRLEAPIVDLEALSRSLSNLLARALERAAPRGVAALLLRLFLEDGGTLEILLEPPLPTRDERLLLDFLRAELEGRSFPSAVIDVELEFAATLPVEREQGRLFGPKRRDPARVRRALERLRRTFGEEAACVAVLHERHRPEERTRRLPFDARPRERSEPPPEEAPEPPPASALRLVSPPLPLRVWTKEGIPCALALPGGRRRRVLLALGPNRISGGWWERPFARDYFEVVDDERGLYRIFRDGRERRWYLHGIVD